MCVSSTATRTRSITRDDHRRLVRRKGRPIFESELVIPSQGIRTTLQFLADTGSDRTLLLPSATIKLGIDFSRLPLRRGKTGGVGGSVLTARAPAELRFHGANTYVYRIEIAVAAPGSRRSPVDALLGRDILERWYLHYDRRIPLLRAENVSADEVFALPDDAS